MDFEFYVLNRQMNHDEIVPFNVFQNIRVSEYTEREIKRYLRNPKKYTRDYPKDGKMGFEALCDEILSIIRWQESHRCEYEFAAMPLFRHGNEKETYMDCYTQCVPNIKIITKAVLDQYKEQIKVMKQKKSVERE